MLPPVDKAVLQNNPQFAALYNTLTTVILNPDGSTKHDPASKEREATRKKLEEHRLTAARHHLLTQAISSAVPPEPKAHPRRATRPGSSEQSPQLPEPLLDLLLLLPPLLSGEQQLSAEDTRLLLSNPPFSELPALLPDLAALVSENLHSSAVLLARLANPTTNPSFIHRTLPTLPEQLRALRSRIEAERAALRSARLAAAGSLADLLQKHTRALTLLVRALEAKHGGVARSLELRAAEVALEARRGEADCGAALRDAREAVYTPEAREALGGYAAHLRDCQVRLREAVRALRAELGEYGVAVEGEGPGDEAKERTMREMARVHREMGRQMDEVKADLERLGRG